MTAISLESNRWWYPEVATLNPCDQALPETISTCRFAQRVANAGVLGGKLGWQHLGVWGNLENLKGGLFS
jgi:hypothetical protein